MKNQIVKITGTCFLLLIVLSVTPMMAVEGVTETAIHIGQTGPLSGPAAIWGGTVTGAALRFQMANENGGIHGRRIVHHTYDDGYNAARTKAGVKRLQESIGIFAWLGGVGTSNGQAVEDYLRKREIPWVGPFSGSDIWFDPPRRTIFSLYPPYNFEVQPLVEYALEKLGKQRLAMVYQNTGFGLSGLKGARAILAEHESNLVAAISIGKNEMDVGQVSLALRQAEADAVLLWISPFSALRLIKVADTMDYAPQWLAPSSLSSLKTFYQLSQGLVEGLITANYATQQQEQLTPYKAAHDRLAPAETWDTPYIAGIAYADILVEALRRCGRDLTREKLITALEQMQDYPSLTNKCRFAPFDPDKPLCRLGIQEIYLQQCLADGQVKVLTDWISIKDYLDY